MKMANSVIRETRWCVRCGDRIDVVALEPPPRFPVLCPFCQMGLDTGATITDRGTIVTRAKTERGTKIT